MFIKKLLIVIATALIMSHLFYGGAVAAERQLVRTFTESSSNSTDATDSVNKQIDTFLEGKKVRIISTNMFITTAGGPGSFRFFLSVTITYEEM
jgi:hypothetical protein